MNTPIWSWFSQPNDMEKYNENFGEDVIDSFHFIFEWFYFRV